MRRTRALAVVAPLGLVAVLAACSAPPAGEPSSAPPTPPSPTAPSPTAPSATATPTTAPTPAVPPAPIDTEYLPGLAAQVGVPVSTAPAPLVVLVPGGGWRSADPAGLVPLAERLTSFGASTALVTYRTTSDGSTFPEGVDDVACAVRWAAADVASLGHPATEVVVLGHSAGGHLAALVSFSGDEYGAGCPAPPVAIDGLVGLAGVYDVDGFRDYLSRWMGFAPNEEPQEWRRADPLTWVRDGARVPDGLSVLLLHGEDDTTVPVDQTAALRTALEDAGIEVRTDTLPGIDHLAVFDADVAGPIVEEWLGGAMGDNQ